jgi:hypothetical protein
MPAARPEPSSLQNYGEEWAKVMEKDIETSENVDFPDEMIKTPESGTCRRQAARKVSENGGKNGNLGAVG